MENFTFWLTITAALMAGLVTAIGIFVINRFASWGKRHVTYFISFAAGVLISVSFLHLVPKSFQMNYFAPIFLLVGFFSLYLLNRFMNIFLCCKDGYKDITFGIIPALGIGFHSFIDGIIYSVTFNVSIFTGVLATIGMILHEFPEGIVTFLFLIKSGFSKKKSTMYAFLAAAITTPLGALISFPFISKLTPPVLGILLSLSAGALIYVGASHLLPKTEKESEFYSLLALAAGILVAIVIILAKG